jgi:hypothetical protein
MKRIVIIAVIIFLLISFVKYSCLAKEMPKPGEVWNNFIKFDTICNHDISDIIKGYYVRAIAQGIIMSTALGVVEGEYDIFDQALFIVENTDEIIEIMDDLYEDPANINITLGWMCIIACDKLKGEDIEGLLQDARSIGLTMNDYFPSY